MKRIALLCSYCLTIIALWAQVPNGYYDDATGYKGASLKTALYGIIKGHTVRSYSQLWTDMQSTDAREDGKVWDMYSNTTDYTFISDQCGNYSGEGSCYNREHSFPKSWFNDASPMYSDLFHLYPTDGYINGMRSNYPFGETNNPTKTSDNGYSKLGPSSVSGYSGTVFEPADEYKGDFARTYFYMATRYEDLIANWDSPMLSGNKYPAYNNWAITMLLRWAKEDPVSAKETVRNNAVYNVQKNRNPYIDFPGLEQYVWGSMTNVAFDPENYTGSSDEEQEVLAPTFTPTAGEVIKGCTINISTETEGAYIVYSLNEGTPTTVASPAEVVITAPTTISAFAQLGNNTSATVEATYTIIISSDDEGVQTFKKVTSESELRTGKKYIIVCESQNTAMSVSNGDIRSYCDITITDDEINSEVGKEGLPYQFTLGGTTGAYTLYDNVDMTYLALTSSNNKLYTSTDAESDETQWSINISDGVATIYNNAYTNRSIQYNAGAPRFACYKSAQKSVSLYVNTTTETSILLPTSLNEKVDVYSIDGRLVKKATEPTTALEGLKKGIYIVKGNKRVVR